MALLHLNLLPWREQQRQQNIKIFFHILRWCIIIIVSVTLLINVYLYLKLKQQQFRNDYLQKQINMLQVPLIELKSSIQKHKTTIARLQTFSAINTQRLQQLKLFNAISNLLPTTAYLRTMENNTPFLILSGQATTQTSIATMLLELKRLSWLKDPELKISINPQQTIYKYDFMLKLRQG